jgi:hypothetical protein
MLSRHCDPDQGSFGLVGGRLFAGLLAVGLAATATVIRAQTEAESLLANAPALRCTFAQSVRTTWRNGAPQPTLRTTSMLTVSYRNINTASGSALLLRTPINKDVTLMASERNLIFLDAGGGRVTMTTVLAEYSTDKRFKASHSIHDYTAIEVGSFRSEPEIVQHWGDCEIFTPS